MGQFNRDFVKLLMLFIVLISFTSGGLTDDKALKECKDGMKAIFGLDKPLLKCVEEAINNFMFDKEYKEDVNEYYWKFYNYATAEHIELRVQFCRRLDEYVKRLIHVDNPNVEECVESLKSFEELKEKILYNALYYHKISFTRDQPNRHTIGTYGALYLESIKNKVALINVLDNNYTPRKFCDEKHLPKKNDDVGTSILSK